MKAGTLRHQIYAQVNTPAQDNEGSWVDSWADEGVAEWASIEPLRGRELFLAQQIKSDVTHKITLRFIHGLTDAKRIRFGQRYFNIMQVLNFEERGIQLEIMAKEITG